MRRIPALILVGSAFTLAACGGTDVVVQAQAGQPVEGVAAVDAEPSPLTEMEVQLVPFDRDAIFDSLAAAADQPEPAVPDSILALQDSISAANITYQQATQRWNVVRDSLKTLSDELQGLSRASGEYRVLFQEFTDLEEEVNALERDMNESFERFSNLQSRFAQQAEEIRLRRGQWADEAFAPVDSIMLAHLEQTGKEILVDTTNAAGMVRFRGVKGDRWWVHARYELPYEELYWNVPVEPEGDETTVILNRGNAEVRTKL